MNKNTKLYILQERLKRYLQAEQAILSGQSYKAEGLELERPDLEAVQSMIAKLQKEISAIENAGSRSRIRYIIPVDSVKRRLSAIGCRFPEGGKL